jgi:hypothetical protein
VSVADQAHREYEPPEVAILEQQTEAGWSDAALGESPPDDGVKAVDGEAASGDPEIRGYVVPEPPFAADDPKLFVAPADPGRKVPRKKHVPKKTKQSGKTTNSHTTRVRLTGHDAFGATVCTCDLICTCNLVCTCEAVSTCSCVSYSASGPSISVGGGRYCTCDTVCTCDLIVM